MTDASTPINQLVIANTRSRCFRHDFSGTTEGLIHLCTKYGVPDSRPRGPSGLAIYLLAARPGRTGCTAQACTLRTGYCEDGHIQCRIRADIEPFEMV